MDRKPVHVILGGTGGIGSAVARQLVADGASLIVWLLSNHASWVTGQVVGIDGGLASLRAKASA